MINTLKLFKLEVFKYIKYNTLKTALLSSTFMAILIYFSSDTELEARSMFNMLLLMETVIMGMLVLVSSLFLEREEGTLKAVVMTPVSNSSIILSKFLTSVVISIASTLILSIGLFAKVGYFDPNIVNIYLLLTVLPVIVFFHTMLGIVLSYISKDFTSLLINYALYTIIFVLPLFIKLFVTLPGVFDNVFLLIPSGSANYIISCCVLNKVDFKFLFSIIYLFSLGFYLFKYHVVKKLPNYIMRGN